MFPGQLYEVSVRDLLMPGDSHGWHVEMRDIVRPEFASREGGNGLRQNSSYRGGPLALRGALRQAEAGAAATAPGPLDFA